MMFTIIYIIMHDHNEFQWNLRIKDTFSDQPFCPLWRGCPLLRGLEIIMGHYELSFLERLSSSQRVLYWRFHTLYNHDHPLTVIASRAYRKEGMQLPISMMQMRPCSSKKLTASYTVLAPSNCACV